MKERLTIAIDCDDVLVDFVRPFLDFYKDLTGKYIDYKDVSTYDLWDVFKCTREEFIEKVRKFYRSTKFDGLIPLDGAVNAMQEINQLAEPVVVTSRYAEAIPKTKKWFCENFPALSIPIEFAGDFQKVPISKLEVYRDKKVNYVVEDNPIYSMQAAASGLKVFLALCPWNALTPQHPNIVRVTSLRDVVLHLSKQH